MKSDKHHKPPKRVPWWIDEPWFGWWKKFRRKQTRKINKRLDKENF